MSFFGRILVAIPSFLYSPMFPAYMNQSDKKEKQVHHGADVSSAEIQHIIVV